MRRNQTFLDGVRVNTVVDLGQRALEIPFQRRGSRFFILEALKFLDQVQLELGAEPRTEFESDILVGIGAAATPSFGIEADGVCGIDPFFRLSFSEDDRTI